MKLDTLLRFEIYAAESSMNEVWCKWMRSLIGATEDEFYFILFCSNVLIGLPTASFFFIDTVQKWNDVDFYILKVFLAKF